MTEPAPILVVFGIDREGKPRASRFADRDAELATKAAAVLGFRLAWVKNKAGREIAEALPEGNVFARGNAFVRLVRQSAFEKLSALIDEGIAATPEQRGSDEG
jgi:succinylarginine dihydrolase